MTRVADRVERRSPAPAWMVLGAVGGGASAIALWNFAREVGEIGLATGPLLAAAMAVSLASGVVYLSLRLREDDFDPAEAWTVTLSALAVGLFVEFGFGLTVLVRVVENRPVGEPTFPLVVIGSLGVLGGAVVGSERVQRRRVTASVTESRDALAFTNSLLRHDVRNALQIIDGRAGLLEDHDDETVRENAAAIRGQVTSLDKLIAEVQSVNDVLTGDLNDETVDLSILLEDVLDAAAAGHPSLSVERELSAELPVAGGEALYAVFRNLVDNAAEHAGTGSVDVRVTGELAGETVRVRVADDGKGVPESERERVFDRGVSAGGGGHGLYVADTIVDRLGGTITVEDSALGGAAFVVELPASDRKSQVAADAFSG